MKQEKLMLKGKNLEDAELLAIILGQAPVS